MPTSANLNELKRQAAYKAVELIESGMIVGLGTGSTAAFAIEALAKRVAAGLNVQAISTSERTTEQAQQLGITLTDFATHDQIDLTIDGADEVEIQSLNLIKGLGGALLREKLVACASKELIIVVDETKLVKKLGSHTAIPVEVVQFAWQTTAQRLAKLGSRPKLRLERGLIPYKTDSDNYILDCQFGQIIEPAELAKQIASVVGVVENGLFIDMASQVIAARSTGIEILMKERRI